LTAADAGAQALADILATRQDAALEMGGLAALLESIAGEPLIADVTLTARHDLDDDQRELLTPGQRDAACSRSGLLRTASGMPVAGVGAVLLPRRVPPPARPALGITPAGQPLDGRRSGPPLEAALRGMGVRWVQLDVLRDPELTDSGIPIALYSLALLRAAQPVGIVVVQVRADFLGAFPPPWSRLSGEIAQEEALR
jgi:hypothetical protein